MSAERYDETLSPKTPTLAGPRSVELAYLGLGSNLGDRAANLWEAARRIHALPTGQCLRLSPLYGTEPVGPVSQPWFLNAVLEVQTALPPIELLHAAQGIEKAMGRVASGHWGPRIIDVDLLLYADLRVESEELVLPHGELWNRRFVLTPLQDLLVPGRLLDRVQARLDELSDRPSVVSYAAVSAHEAADRKL